LAPNPGVLPLRAPERFGGYGNRSHLVDGIQRRRGVAHKIGSGLAHAPTQVHATALPCEGAHRAPAWGGVNAGNSIFEHTPKPKPPTPPPGPGGGRNKF
jgi:hypothetical protein